MSPTSLDFGPQAIGTSSAPQAVTFTNSSSFSLFSISITVSGSDQNHAGDFRPATTCGIILEPGTSCNIAVTFVPSETGAQAQVLTVDSTGSGGPSLTVHLSGMGTPVQLQLLSQSMLAFGITIQSRLIRLAT
ncbi:MAG TPA: choice-of-anchor D domain-containing protein [Bryobacteraceae bacterium]